MRDIINLKEYIDQLDKEFQRKAKKSRNKDKYEILNKKPLRIFMVNPFTLSMH